MSHREAIHIRPIGVVTTDVADEDVPRRRRTMVSDIITDPEYADALTGLSDYSHIFVLFWMHRAAPSAHLVHPRGNSDLPLTGVLASRGRGHPNPIGLAVAELLGVKANTLTVRRLDAYNGTPVIDIKPYDQYDVYTDIKLPKWFSDRLRGS